MASPDLSNVAPELLAKGEGRGVLGVDYYHHHHHHYHYHLGVGSPDLDDVLELLCLGVQSVVKLPGIEKIFKTNLELLCSMHNAHNV